MRARHLALPALLALLALLALVAGVASAADPPGGAGTPLSAGSAGAGRALFVGSRPFQNGGAPCSGCHALGGEGLAVTAKLGPDLSKGLSGMDLEMLDALLENIPSPSMAPVYEGRALTSAERADLAAYLLRAVTQGPPRDAWHFEALGVLGAVILLIGPTLAWRRRKPSSRARLLASAYGSQRGPR